MESKNFSLSKVAELYEQDETTLTDIARKKMAVASLDDDLLEKITKTQLSKKNLETLYEKTKDLKSKKYIDNHIWISSDSSIFFYEEDHLTVRKISTFQQNQGRALPKPIYKYLFESCVDRFVVNVYPNLKTGVDIEKKQINLMAPSKFMLDENYVETEEEKAQIDFVFENYIRDIVCQSNDYKVEYFLNALAGQIQVMKLGVVMYLYSATQGTGKSTIIELLRRLMGDQFYGACAKDFDYTGNFVGKPCVAVEETDDGDDYRKQGAVMKGMTTAEDYTYRALYDNAKRYPNVNSIWFTSNYKIAEMFGRRFAIFHVSTKMEGDEEYWEKIYTILNNSRLLYCIAQRLLRRDVSKFNFGKVPMDDKIEIIRENLPYSYQWIKKEFIFAKKSRKMQRAEAYASFKSFTASCGKKTVCKSTFFSNLQEIRIPGSQPNEPIKIHGNYYFNFQYEELTKQFIGKSWTDESEINEAYEAFLEAQTKNVFIQGDKKIQETVSDMKGTIESQKQEIASLKAEIERLKRTPQKEEQIPEKVVEKVVEKKRKVPHRNLQAAVISLGELL